MKFATLALALPLLLCTVMPGPSAIAEKPQQKPPANPSPANVSPADMFAQTILDAFFRQDAKTIETLAPKAIPSLEKGLGMSQKKDRVYFALYVCFMMRGDKQNALDGIEAAYKLAPTNTVYETYYGLSLKIAGRAAEALDVYKKLSRETGHPDGMENAIGLLSMSIQKYDDALHVLGRLSESEKEVSEDKAILLSELADCHLYKGEYPESLALFKQSEEMHATVTGSALYGEALLKSGDAAGSLPHFDRALKDNPKSIPALYYKGVALEALDRKTEASPLYDQALAAAQEGLKVTADEGYDHFLLGLIQTKLGKPEEAQQSFADAKKLGYSYEAPYKKAEKADK